MENSKGVYLRSIVLLARSPKHVYVTCVLELEAESPAEGENRESGVGPVATTPPVLGHARLRFEVVVSWKVCRLALLGLAITVKAISVGTIEVVDVASVAILAKWK